jgi:hypothetical protein
MTLEEGKVIPRDLGGDAKNQRGRRRDSQKDSQFLNGCLKETFYDLKVASVPSFYLPFICIELRFS